MNDERRARARARARSERVHERADADALGRGLGVEVAESAAVLDGDASSDELPASGELRGNRRGALEVADRHAAAQHVARPLSSASAGTATSAIRVATPIYPMH